MIEAMVALRSRRLQTLLGVSLDDLKYEHLEALVTNRVPEAFDLDFKKQLYGNGDTARRDLAGDVAALANQRGLLGPRHRRRPAGPVRSRRLELL